MRFTAIVLLSVLSAFTQATTVDGVIINSAAHADASAEIGGQTASNEDATVSSGAIGNTQINSFASGSTVIVPGVTIIAPSTGHGTDATGVPSIVSDSDTTHAPSADTGADTPTASSPKAPGSDVPSSTLVVTSTKAAPDHSSAIIHSSASVSSSASIGQTALSTSAPSTATQSTSSSKGVAASVGTIGGGLAGALLSLAALI